jgi:gas vesicle protein
MNTKELEDYKKSLLKKTDKQLEDLEQEIIKEIELVDLDCSTASIELPSDNYKEVAEAIQYFIDQQQTTWEYALAMINMYDFWNPEKKQEKIPYPQLDQIMRILGERQYRGIDECRKVCAINTYFIPLHNWYKDITQRIWDTATRHNAIVDELQKRKGKPEDAANAPMK